MTVASHCVTARRRMSVLSSQRVHLLMLSASVGALLLAAGPAVAQQSTMTTAGDWNTAANWDNGVPTAADLAYISTAGTVGTPATLAAAGTAGTVSIDGGNELDVNAGGTLTVVGTAAVGQIAGGLSELNVAAGGTLTANRLIIGNNTAGTNGQVTVAGVGAVVTIANGVDVGGNGDGTINLTGGGILSVTAGLTRVGTGIGNGAISVDALSTFSAVGGGVAIGANGGVLNNGVFSVGQQITNSGLFNNFGQATAGTGFINAIGGGIMNGAGGTLTITTGDLTNSALVFNFGTIQASAGNIVNKAGALITNSGTLTAAQQIQTAGGILNLGTLTGGTGVSVQSTGNIGNAAGATVTATTGDVNNAGIITNSGTVRALAGKVVNTATATLTNNAGGVVTAAQTVLNSGIVTNSGSITGGTGIVNLAGGWITNNAGASLTATTGAVVNNALIDNSGAISALAGDVVNTATGTLNNLVGGTINASANVVNGRTLNNSGTITAGTSVVNSASAVLTNNAGATVTATTGSVVNNGTVGNAGLLQALAGNIVNSGTGLLTNDGTATAALQIINSGTFINNKIATAGTGIINNGSMTNNAGGTLTATTGNFITNDSLLNFGLINVAAGSLINNAGGAVVNKAGGIINANVNVTNAGTVINDGAINAITGTLTNQATGIITNNAAGTLSAGTLVLNQGDLRNAGTVTAPTVRNTNVLRSTGVVNAATLFDNTGTAFMAGTLNAGTVTNSGTFNVNGALVGPVGTFTNTGTVNLTQNFTGIGVFNNGGVFNATGVRTLGVATFNNQAAGTVSMVNGSVVDALTMTGTYNGQGGRILVDIDLSKLAGTRADILTAAVGAGNGTIAFQFLNGSRVGFVNPITVVNAPGLVLPEGSLVGLNGAADQGFFKYYLRQTAPGSGIYQVISQFNAAPAAGVASGLSGMVTALQAGFHQPNSAIISRPDECMPNQIMGGPFIRENVGDTKTDANSAGALTNGGGGAFSGSSSSRAQFKGIQGGFDLGVCNIQGTGWNVHGGIMGGFVDVLSKATARTVDQFGNSVATSTKAQVEVPFFGFYSFVTKGPFTVEANVRKDFYRASITSYDNTQYYVGPRERLTGNGMNYNFAASYRFLIGENMYFEPAIGFSKGITRFRNLQFATAATDFMSFDRSDSMLGRIGFNVGYTFLATDKLAVVPFAHVSVWREFAGVNKAYASIGAGPQVFGITTDRVGTFGQVGAGMQFKLLESPLLGFIRGDLRFGQKIEGKALNAGLRLQF